MYTISKYALSTYTLSTYTLSTYLLSTLMLSTLIFSTYLSSTYTIEICEKFCGKNRFLKKCSSVYLSVCDHTGLWPAHAAKKETELSN